jgi:hypothetical protein
MQEEYLSRLFASSYYRLYHRLSRFGSGVSSDTVRLRDLLIKFKVVRNAVESTGVSANLIVKSLLNTDT